MTSWKLVAAWVAVLVVTTTLTWQIVSFADNQVSARPVAVTPSTSTTEVLETTSTIDPDPTSTATSPTTTVPGSDGSSTSTSSSSPSSTSTSSPSSTPTSGATEWSVRTITTDGGVVVVRYVPGEVELQAATPAPGFEMEIDDAGPPRVRVEFEDNDTDIRVDVRWQNGQLDVEVSGEV